MNYLYAVVTVVAIFSMLTIALNLQFGQAGIINFGLVAYFAIGAYTYAILTAAPPTELSEYAFGFGLSPWISAPIAVAAAVTVGWAVAKPALRLQPEYLALATFALAQVLESLLVNIRMLANGNIGMSGVALPGSEYLGFRYYDLSFMVITLSAAALVFLTATKISNSPFGSAVRATRDDPIAAAAIGKNVGSLRQRSFLLGCAVAGFAGIFYASYTSVVAPSLFTADVTFAAFIALVIGGLGSHWGAVIGVCIYYGIEKAIELVPLTGDLAETVASLRIVVFGIALIIVLRFWPGGLVSLKNLRSPQPKLEEVSA